MVWKIQLDFTRSLLKNMHLSCCTVEKPEQHIPAAIDLGLREMLFGTENYTTLLENSMYNAAPNTIYRFFDEYYCNYLFLQLPLTGEFFFVGPYLTGEPLEEMVNTKSQALSLSSPQKERLRQYYSKLPILEDETTLFAIINTLGNALWSGEDSFTLEYVDYMIPDRAEPLAVSPAYLDTEDSPFTLAVLEENYTREKQLMKAVSEGKLHKVNAISPSVYQNGTMPRVSDSLRNRKNYLIILNTLLRSAAGQGGVHPFHIDRISSAFAKKIEQIHSLKAGISLQTQMLRDYCLLVKNHSLNQYSPLVGKAITLISYDLTADLSLRAIAKTLMVNPTYLSGLFSKEMDCTLTDYVNQKRMEKAVFLLQTTKKQVSQIAFECGTPDTNYFIKLFKKYAGTTPSRYRTQNTLIQ